MNTAEFVLSLYNLAMFILYASCKQTACEPAFDVNLLFLIADISSILMLNYVIAFNPGEISSLVHRSPHSCEQGQTIAAQFWQ